MQAIKKGDKTMKKYENVSFVIVPLDEESVLTSSSDYPIDDLGNFQDFVIS